MGRGDDRRWGLAVDWIPRGAAVAASWVSSDMWAEASYPVNVYCAFSRPISIM